MISEKIRPKIGKLTCTRTYPKHNVGLPFQHELNRNMCEKIATVLLAEDDPNDAFLVQRAFKKAQLPHHIVHVLDGQQAIDYLSGVLRYDSRVEHPLPDLLLLDLKMPRLTGFEVLQWLRDRSEFKGLRAVVLSSSEHEQDVAEARALGAVDYFRKPGDPADLLAIVRTLDERWLREAHTESSARLAA